MLKLIVSLIFICVIKCTAILDVWSVKQKPNYLMEYQKKNMILDDIVINTCVILS